MESGRSQGLTDLLELAEATEINDQQPQLVRDGMELLAGYLASA